ncbi:threonine-phosphate decarboxylase CobD [Clostridium cylindrosporum]|uniref:threonine-phosphate decarboxylase n=1 Tax=Clostridium cylindrosporum DSM 605 TaxID=1121307 RepID=A0A0J8D8T3_CLOCY|nr:threonine-phosphate decarboxylase CobD [Clostridium cylindrosporum]KMT22287.1 threonine-phosphate decarboxylase CobD [Clostridium cylindrosporum DSM 605]
MGIGHGGNVEEISRKYNINEADIIDFSANINPLGLCGNVKKEMIKAIDKVERYPDITYFNLKKAISGYEKISEDNIVLGNGAAEVIFNIARALKPSRALLIAPTFIEYEEALVSVNCTISHYKLNEDFILDSRFISKINEDTDIIFICNPNNPTGILTSRDYIIDVIKKAERFNATVVIDESFLDFVEDKEDYSVIDLTKLHKNLIVVKSLTKFFAFPGIRIGYGITSNSEYKSNLEKISVSWAVNTVASFGAEAALSESDYIKDSIAYVKKENEFLYSELIRFPELKVYKGAVNFMFFKCNKEIDLKESLLKHGVLIRSCDNYIGLKVGYYRVAVRTRDENIKLIQALKEVL